MIVGVITIGAATRFFFGQRRAMVVTVTRVPGSEPPALQSTLPRSIYAQ